MCWVGGVVLGFARQPLNHATIESTLEFHLHKVLGESVNE